MGTRYRKVEEQENVTRRGEIDAHLERLGQEEALIDDEAIRVLGDDLAERVEAHHVLQGHLVVRAARVIRRIGRRRLSHIVAALCRNLINVHKLASQSAQSIHGTRAQTSRIR